MKIKLIFTCLILISCNRSPTNNSMNASSSWEEVILQKTKYKDGQIKLITKSAIIGGEDSYIKTEEFDTNGNPVKEYGYKPYGMKYKVIRSFIDSNLINETEYVYSFQDQNYKYMELYDTSDILINYPEIDSFISSSQINEFYPNSILKRSVFTTINTKDSIDCDDVDLTFLSNFDKRGNKISEFTVFGSDTTNWQIWVYLKDQVEEQIKFTKIYEDCNIVKDTIIEKLK